MKKNYKSFDIAKFVCCFLVVMIHVHPFESINKNMDFLLIDIFAGIAVPLFFALSGYLLFEKLEFKERKLINTDNNRQSIIIFFLDFILFLV